MTDSGNHTEFNKGQQDAEKLLKYSAGLTVGVSKFIFIQAKKYKWILILIASTTIIIFFWSEIEKNINQQYRYIKYSQQKKYQQEIDFKNHTALAKGKVCIEPIKTLSEKSSTSFLQSDFKTYKGDQCEFIKWQDGGFTRNSSYRGSSTNKLPEDIIEKYGKLQLRPAIKTINQLFPIDATKKPKTNRTPRYILSPDNLIILNPAYPEN